jgi:hypothetical protein
MPSHDALAQYLRNAAGVPFEIGSNDCAMFVGDWVLQRTGIDPCAQLRGTYATYDEYCKMVEGEKMLSIFANCLSTIGAETTELPVRGDVGVFINNRVLAVGIFTGTAWAGKAQRGIFILRNAFCLKAYKVLHE